MVQTGTHGVCRLTGQAGVLVKSHLIPVALTRLSRTGAKYVEAGIGLGVKHRSSSWYDSNLVTRAGEDILSAIDHRGIRALRDSKLVWSSWGADNHLESDDLVVEDGRPLWRCVDIADPIPLRLFFQSLVWRAAASSVPGFEEVVVPDVQLEDLRGRVLACDPGDLHHYPVQLFQMISRGVDHNRTPLLEEKVIPTPGVSAGPQVSYVRFWFDGLVSHVHLDHRELSPDYLATTLGGAKKTIVFAHEFEHSRTFENLKEMVMKVDAEARKPPIARTAVARAASAATRCGPRRN